jgi:hypothetical protein
LFQGNETSPGLAVFGHHNGFTGMGGIDQPGKLGLGLVNIDGSHSQKRDIDPD